MTRTLRFTAFSSRHSARGGGWGAVLALSAALLLAGPGLVKAQAPGSGHLLILAAGDLRGEIEPCGCSPEGQLGGLRRRMSYLEHELNSGAPIVLDLGNNFAPPSPQGRLKMALIQVLLPHFPPAAVLPGPHELAMGPDAWAKGPNAPSKGPNAPSKGPNAPSKGPEAPSNGPEAPTGGLAYVVSNDAVGRVFAPHRTVVRGGRRIGIYGYLSPGEVYQGSQSRFRLEAVTPGLLGRLRSSIRRERHAVAILLFRGSDAELGVWDQSGLFDLIVAGNPSDNELEQITARRVNGREIAQVPTKGQGFLRIRLATKEKSGPESWQVSVDWLKEKWPDHPGAAAAFRTYNEGVKARFLDDLAAMEKQKRDSPFAGAKSCRACHAGAGKVWSGSRHARALATLERVGKQFDPECLACHVVGFRPVSSPAERSGGGFLSRALTPSLGNVQCENCHGPARAHGRNPLVRPGPAPSVDGQELPRPGEATCRTCHRGSHSPTFDFKAYWPKVAHQAVRPGRKSGTR